MSPEEFQKRLEEMMKRFPGGGFPGFTPPGSGASGATAEPTSSPTPPEEEEEPISDPLSDFSLKPRDVKSYLDRYVIRQDDAKKALSVALCDHYNHVRAVRDGNAIAQYAKQNVILIGPTGVGKTYLIRSIADLIGVPFVKADATKFSETGYVGGDVDDLVRDLVRQADGDVERAQYGIIYIDEIDKIAGSRDAQIRDVSGRGVQTNLLKLMEETEVSTRSQNDFSGQLQFLMAMGDRQRKQQPSTISTRHILFVVSGAFDGLDEIVRKRLRQAQIGFQPDQVDDSDDEAIVRETRTQDLIEYGFEPEFVGRLPVRVVCQSLDVEALFEIMRSSEGSLVRQYEESFLAYGIEMNFQETALRRIAEMAHQERTGARGLMTVCERVFRDFKFELPSTDVRRLSVTPELVDRPEEALEATMASASRQVEGEKTQLVHEFAAAFRQQHGVELVFTEPAAARLALAAMDANRPVRDLCAERFRDFQFGLKLIAKNTGQTRFELQAEDVVDPQKSLSEWVVASYRSDGSDAEKGD